jgi:hypothetical protein
MSKLTSTLLALSFACVVGLGLVGCGDSTTKNTAAKGSANNVPPVDLRKAAEAKKAAMKGAMEEAQRKAKAEADKGKTEADKAKTEEKPKSEVDKAGDKGKSEPAKTKADDKKDK